MKKNFAKIVALVIVVAMCAVVLAACVPSDYSKAEANLKEANYEVVTIDGKLAEAEVAIIAKTLDVELTGKCTQIVTGLTDEDGITIYYFDNTADAKAFKDAYKANSDKAADEIEKAYKDGDIDKEEYEEYKEEMKEFKYGASGKAFYMGTADAVNAAN